MVNAGKYTSPIDPMGLLLDLPPPANNSESSEGLRWVDLWSRKCSLQGELQNHLEMEFFVSPLNK